MCTVYWAHGHEQATKNELGIFLFFFVLIMISMHVKTCLGLKKWDLEELIPNNVDVYVVPWKLHSKQMNEMNTKMMEITLWLAIH